MSQPTRSISKIVIVGGGTAGWMAASLLQQAWQTQGCEISLIESSDIGTVGVGEGSTPYMRKFFAKLGISESEWMPACNATYKCGINFPNWSTHKGFESYYHPFFSTLDQPMAEAFFHNCTVRRKGFEAPTHPDRYFVAPALSANYRSPIPRQKLPAEPDYAYHFDAGLLGTFLKQRARKLGIKHLIGNVTNVPTDEQGDIRWLDTDSHGRLDADLFIDCSGFAGLLINKTLKEPFIPFSDNLFNDCAVAIPSPVGDPNKLPSETESTALSSGWAWKIPLLNRFGNGYVYSSKYLSKEQAEQELREHIGPDADGQEARHIRMRVGRVERHWRNNCLAVGLSQGFIEPLEATALGLVQYTVEEFIERFDSDDSDELAQQVLNERVNNAFEETRDYIVLHYKINSRDDSDYWCDNRNNENISDKLRGIIDSWNRGEGFEASAKSQAYTLPSWYCIFAGMGQFPSELKAAPDGYVAPVQEASDMASKISELFHPHGQLLLKQR